MRVAAWGEASYALSACAAAVSGPGGVEGQDAPLVACGPAPCPGLGCFPPRLEGFKPPFCIGNPARPGLVPVRVRAYMGWKWGQSFIWVPTPS